MRRIIIVICIAICVGVLLVACSSIKSFETPRATKVELRSGNTGNIVEITDADNIEQITNNINSLRPLAMMKSSIQFLMATLI